MDAGRRMPQIAHRPVFPDIRENHFEEQYGDAHYVGSPSIYQPPLPAPTPQRSACPSMAAQLESNNGYSQVARRTLHGRSRSDIGFLGYTYSPPPQYTQRQYRGEPSGWSDTRMNDPLSGQGHQRHQSTPMAQSSYSETSMSYGRQPQLPHHPHPQQRNNLPFAPRQVSETDETRTLYSARR
jgi:hypothetical protein